MTDAVSVEKPIKPAGPFSAWEFGLAFRYLRAKRKEGGVALIAVISYVAIALAVMALITVMSIMGGFRATLLDRMLSFNGHMFVQGYVLSSPNRDAVIERIGRVPGVISVSPLTNSQSLVQARGQTTGAIVRGIRPQDLDSMSFVYNSLTPEARRSFGQGPYGGDGIIIGKALADSMGLAVGDPITLFSPTGADSAIGNLGGLEKVYRVGGVFTSGTAEFDRAFMFMPLEQAQLFFGKEGVWDVVELKVENPDQIDRLLTPVREATAGMGIVTDWRDGMAAFWGALKVERVAMSIVLGLVVAIAALNIISGIVMLVKNKTRDIAILRTVGASQASMLRIFFIAGATIGVAGTLTGLVLGLLFCLNVASIQHFLEGLFGVQLFNAEVYMLDAIPAKVDPIDVIWVTIWSVFMSCVASLLPSWRAAKMDPVEALRYE
ncbi:lipoprotein-releasing ABC transporter permease subunit [Brevundimonas sp. Root1279]|uniref:lipoprotein-releasing ABC transporter permease subunit n=1 Tax=Brevundimonas sp. Root1279 TaxID=1736443 RepID=UPI0006F23F16|nr:lipoprotein-releasing ABC transporter permease subunit [Brevundimonas sp. Root1279]KQW83850.1 multidrug ABC transporter substrate-binding protein [Brevundimonas sp. Root1279]